jgi:TRAP-type mannitol/chloroaromatic compound transport system permease small subunit
MIDRFIYSVDQLSRMVGHAFAWCIIILTLGTSYEVFVRYALNNPTSWAFDFSYLMYGGLFFMAGAYTLSRNGHVRADMLYRTLKPRTQAAFDLVLYILFFLPGIAALVYAGVEFTQVSWAMKEVSSVTSSGTPIYPFKLVIPIAGGLLLLQGLAEIARCIVCLRTGQWPQRLHDVEEEDVEAFKEILEGGKAR